MNKEDERIQESVEDSKACVVKSLLSDRRWSDNVFISEGNFHLTSRFCGVLGSTIISKMRPY